MKKKLKLIGSTALVASLLGDATARADIFYSWNQHNSSPSGAITTGSLDINFFNPLDPVVESVSWIENGITYSSSTDTWQPSGGIGDGGVIPLTDGNVALDGNLVVSSSLTINFNPFGVNSPPTSPYEQNILDDFHWSPVPEPTTMIAGAFLLLPMGASAFRVLRKNRAV